MPISYSRLLLLLPAVAALSFTSCVDDEGYTSVSVDRGGHYGGGGSDVDFYYEGESPYSRDYGQLYLRSGRYYYSRGGTYYTYNRPTRSYRGSYSRSSSSYRDHDRDRDHDHDRNRYSDSYRGRDDNDRDRDYRSSTSRSRTGSSSGYASQQRSQQNVQAYRQQQVYNQNQQKLSAQQSQQRRVYEQNQTKIKQYQATHSQPKKKDKKDDDD